MNTFQIAQLFRNYCDEPDQSFLTDADVALYCKLGYDEFRQIVNQINPHILARHVIIQVNGSPSYDLTQLNATATGATTPSVAGTAPNYFDNMAGAQLTWGRMTKLLEVWSMGSSVANNTQPLEQFEICNNPAQLHTIGTNRVMLRGEYAGGVNASIGTTLQTLTWNGSQTQFFKLVLSHEQEIGLVYNAVYANGTWEADWTNAITATGALPLGSMGTTAGVASIKSDGLETWHDIIPLLAYSQYAIADLSINPILNNRLAMRLAAFKEYLQSGIGNNHYVLSSAEPGDFR
jgi:hypothetical protein